VDRIGPYIAPQGFCGFPFTSLAVNLGQLELRHQAVGTARLQRLAEARGRGLQLSRLQPKLAKLVQQQAIARRRHKFASRWSRNRVV
jgi:hypothetical protein